MFSFLSGTCPPSLRRSVAKAATPLVNIDFLPNCPPGSSAYLISFPCIFFVSIYSGWFYLGECGFPEKVPPLSTKETYDRNPLPLSTRCKCPHPCAVWSGLLSHYSPPIPVVGNISTFAHSPYCPQFLRIFPLKIFLPPLRSLVSFVKPRCP